MRQHQALQEELDKYKEVLAGMPFHSKTVEPPLPWPHPAPVETDVRPSSLGLGEQGTVLLGVFPKYAQAATCKGTPALARSDHTAA